MNEFFKFIFNFEIINNVLRPEWIKLYDFMHVDSKLIAGLKKNNDIFSELINAIHNKVSAGSILNSTKDGSLVNEVNRKVTIPEPFNLTKQKPRKTLEPLAIQNKLEARPMPVANFEKTNLEKLEVDLLQRKKENLIVKKLNLFSRLRRKNTKE